MGFNELIGGVEAVVPQEAEHTARHLFAEHPLVKYFYGILEHFGLKIQDLYNAGLILASVLGWAREMASRFKSPSARSVSSPTALTSSITGLAGVGTLGSALWADRTLNSWRKRTL